MSQPECGNCARPVPDGAGICTHCTTALTESLRGVPDLIENLFITFTKQDRLGASGGHRGKLAEAPLPVRFDITRVIDAVSNEMTTWARDLVERNGWDVPNPPRRSAHNGAHGVVFYASSPKVDLACYAAEWLADHAEQLRQHPAALEVHRGVTRAIEAAESAMDRPEPQLFVGHCELCAATLYAPRDATGTRCERCGAYVADLAERWDRALLKLRGYPATASVIGGWVGDVSGVLVNQDTIRKWHQRDEITPVDWVPLTEGGQRTVPRFRIGAVLDRAERAAKAKAAQGRMMSYHHAKEPPNGQ